MTKSDLLQEFAKAALPGVIAATGETNLAVMGTPHGGGYGQLAMQTWEIAKAMVENEPDQIDTMGM